MAGTTTDAIGAAIARLRDPATIRERCGQLYVRAEAGRSEHFRLLPERLDATADYVLAVMRDNYPDLAVPYHSRWRHFAAGGRDRWAVLLDELDASPDEIARIGTELTIVSVLLDAGAGADWCYRDDDGREYRRSEGLAIASLRMYRAGLFSARPEQPLRVDATALRGLDAARLSAGFQAGPANPLVGLGGRLGLLRRLSEVLDGDREHFGPQARLGGVFDRLAAQTRNGVLSAPRLLVTVLAALAPIWPGRIALGGVNLGDVWRHPAVRGDPLTAGLIPFHKLSQWLSYSLIEPLESAGFTLTELEQLTGLPEYRNGGLFIDAGVLVPKEAAVVDRAHPVDSELVVEWRALTVMLLDRLAERIRARLGLDAAQLPLARVLEGGSWAAGRRIAAERRPRAQPPIAIISDGTVF